MKLNSITPLILASFLVISLGAAEQALAKKKRRDSKRRYSKRRYSTPFGMAGCGLGSIIMTKKDKNSQMVASVINTYIGFVSSSITSGTSNCSYLNQTAEIEQKVYISSNLNSLEKEAVQGSGAHLRALAQLFGCEEDEDQTKFEQFNKEHFDEIYHSRDAADVYLNLKRVGNESSGVTSACSGLS